MSKATDICGFRYQPGAKIHLHKTPTETKPLYSSKEEYQKKLASIKKVLKTQQGQIHAAGRHSVLVVFQAMDAAGKDSTIEHVFSGVDPQGIHVTTFKSPSSRELRHDFLWRSLIALPERGKIAVHNRSHYEEVVVCKVHPNIVLDHQKMPTDLTEDLDLMYEGRYESIRGLEKHLSKNGTKIIKFFLHVSREEQAKRLLGRIEEKAKNYKFEEADMDQREFWDEYMKCYEEAMMETGTEECPWYIIPADDKKNMRLLVAEAVVHELSKLDLAWPVLDDKQLAMLESCRGRLSAEIEEHQSRDKGEFKAKTRLETRE